MLDTPLKTIKNACFAKLPNSKLTACQIHRGVAFKKTSLRMKTKGDEPEKSFFS
jgi:hypothetical protein